MEEALIIIRGERPPGEGEWVVGGEMLTCAVGEGSGGGGRCTRKVCRTKGKPLTWRLPVKKVSNYMPPSYGVRARLG